MLYKALGIGIGLFVCAAIYYRRHSRSNPVLSTTEWVHLMRENDVRIKAEKERNEIKLRSRKV
jgi:hypothetical protein